MPRRQTEVEQCGDLHRLQQADGAEWEAFTLTEFSEMLVAPGEQFLCRTLAVGKIGKVGSAVGQMGGGVSCSSSQHGEGNSLVSDNDTKLRGRRVVSGKADQFHGSSPVLDLD